MRSGVFVHVKSLGSIAKRFSHDRGGQFAMMTAIILPVLLVGIGGAVQFQQALEQKKNYQQALDLATVAAAPLSDSNAQLAMVRRMLNANSGTVTLETKEIDLSLTNNADKSISTRYQVEYTPTFLSGFGFGTFQLDIKSTAIASTGSATASPCIMVLGNTSQSLLVNSGAKLNATQCQFDVNSVQNPAYMMNSGSELKVQKFCVKGTKFTNNGGTITNAEHGCTTVGDPYASKLPTVTVPTNCTTSGAKDGASFTLSPGVHCGVIFNGSPTITFSPGLHIIKNTMIINANSTVIANGVTFYFPDSGSKIQFNGGITMTATAPTSGTYQGILMYENTTTAQSKQGLVFNGTKGEVLEGLIYLPNRNVTYNSTNNSTSKLSLVVNTMIMNAANWQVSPYESGIVGQSGGAATAARLVK